MIEVRSVTKRYSTVTAVKEISLVAQPGEIFGLIGPNGAGKSSTIRMIMNITKPDEGEILFSGKALSEADKDRIGYLPEERGLYKKMKVNDALLYFASIKNCSAKQAQPEIDRWLKAFDLEEWKFRKVSELSKGMAQKVQFIASIAHKPDLVLFDEPFSGLDPVSAETLLDAMVKLRDEGRTVFFSTHIMEHAERICNRILLINHGVEVISGPLAQVKSKFGRNAVVVEFDGDGNFIAKLPCVAGIVEYPRHVEVELANGHKSDELFEALAGKVSVKRFELVSPSLHKIFISLVGEQNGDKSLADGKE